MSDATALRPVVRALRLTYGLVPFLAGLDKFFGLLADWASYVSPHAAALLPVPVGTFMAIVGVVEMAVGVLVLTRWPRLGALLATGWLVVVALNLSLAGRLDVATRDLAMAVGAFTLAHLVALEKTANTAPGRRVAVTA